MGKINYTRVLLGGLLAGLVINVGEYILNVIVLADQFAAFREQFGLGALGAGEMAAAVIITFLYGIVLIWIYAAIRPRFGAGPKTAIIAGLVLWVIAYVLFTGSLWAGGVLSASITVTSIVWGIFEAPIAALAGAWLYREEAA